VYDGGHVEANCTDINKATFSYNAAIYTQGAAFMYNFTESDEWKDRLDNLIDATIDEFFPDDIAFEVNCETHQGACSPDMLSFKGYVHRWLAVVTQIAPHTQEKLRPILRTSAEAAARQCTGGESGRACGFYWSGGEFVDVAVDKTSGAGEAMNVLAAVSSLLIDEADPPATNTTGGISQGNPNAGGAGNNGQEPLKPITTGDRAGAAILTILILGGAISMFVWMSMFE
jgi:mannan endo-1,6-alpha-mannosidase